jgi:hypothetical protein
MEMGLIAKDSGSFTPVPAGMHLARCYRIVDLGTQKSEYKGQVKHQPKAMFQFEIHGEDDKGAPMVTADGKPLSIAKSYTVNLSDKSNLRKDLQMWRGRDFTAQELRGFELTNVLGVWAMLTVSHTESNGKTYTNIASVNPVPMAMKKAGLPEGVNELKVFRIAEPDMALFDSFSENLKNKIMSSPEWQELHGNVVASESKPKDTSDHFNDFDNDLDGPPPF